MPDQGTFLRGAGAASVPAIAPAWAQPQGRPPRIGCISGRGGPNEFEQAFLRRLREQGWIDGQNLVIDVRFAAFDRNRAQAMVTGLLALQPVLMVNADGPPSGSSG